MVEGSEKKDDPGFVVIDRRGRDADEEPSAASGEDAAARPASQEPEASEAPDAPQVDFSMLILSLSHSAFYHLGLVEDPATGKAGPVEKPLARNDIDMLEILQQKTRGNLTSDEEKLLQSLLYDLRLRFVEAG